MAVMDIDKENRPPQSMMAEGKGRISGGRLTLTPSRLQRQKKQDQYFEVGKVGRKTGLTLPDNGERDEHGLEPVSGIFDSPIKSPQHNGDQLATSSSDMQLQESSATEVDRALQMRKTPKLPPPRASTPKHTNIGSPKRMSTGRQPHTTGKPLISRDREGTTSPERQLSRTQPPANRLLDFGEAGVAKSIESLSPFKPKKSLRRSMARQDPFASPEPAIRGVPRSKSVAEAIETVEETARWISTDDSPIVQQSNDDWQPIVDDGEAEQPEEGESELPRPASPSTQLQARLSSSHDDNTDQTISDETSSGSKKRNRASMEGEQVTRAAEKKTGRRRTTVFDSPIAQRRQTRISPDESVILQHDDETGSIDPSLLAQSEQYSVEEVPMEPMEPPAKKSRSKAKAPALKERDPNRPSRPPGSPVKLNDVGGTSSKSPSRRPGSRGMSLGPSNNLNFRATTPFEDATSTSRFGRPIIQPLQYWANETRVWKNGECEGIIRAEEVVKPKPKKKGRKKKRKTTTRLGDIDEESETESVMPDEWEQEVGVIAGTVANWDPATQSGNSNDPIKEGKSRSYILSYFLQHTDSLHIDLGFASTSIITRDVPGSEFKYAKIMTLPFFGSGIVELPPEGFKRAKNSRKMQMCFFVHEGKVMVEIGAQGMQGEVNAFAISKGGVWVVPRGNNYAITNESRTRTAKIFFAQGCEVDASGSTTVA